MAELTVTTDKPNKKLFNFLGGTILAKSLFQKRYVSGAAC